MQLFRLQTIRETILLKIICHQLHLPVILMLMNCADNTQTMIQIKQLMRKILKQSIYSLRSENNLENKILVYKVLILGCQETARQSPQSY